MNYRLTTAILLITSILMLFWLIATNIMVNKEISNSQDMHSCDTYDACISSLYNRLDVPFQFRMPYNVSFSNIIQNLSTQDEQLIKVIKTYCAPESYRKGVTLMVTPLKTIEEVPRSIEIYLNNSEVVCAWIKDPSTNPPTYISLK